MLREYAEGDYTDFMQSDMDVHHWIVESCGNTLIKRAYDGFSRDFRYYGVRASYALLGVKKSEYYQLEIVSHQHLAIFNAISMGLLNSAREIMEQHLSTVHRITYVIAPPQGIK